MKLSLDKQNPSFITIPHILSQKNFVQTSLKKPIQNLKKRVNKLRDNDQTTVA